MQRAGIPKDVISTEERFEDSADSAVQLSRMLSPHVIAFHGQPGGLNENVSSSGTPTQSCGLFPHDHNFCR